MHNENKYNNSYCYMGLLGALSTKSATTCLSFQEQTVCRRSVFRKRPGVERPRFRGRPRPSPCSGRAAFRCVHNQTASPAAIQQTANGQRQCYHSLGFSQDLGFFNSTLAFSWRPCAFYYFTEIHFLEDRAFLLLYWNSFSSSGLNSNRDKVINYLSIN